jgi:hypothetical protein
VLRPFSPLQQLGNEPAKAQAAVIGGQMHFGPRKAKVLNAGCQISRAHAVEEGHTLDRSAGRLIAVTTVAQELPNVGQKGRLTDSARYQSHLINTEEVGKSVTERTPYFHIVAGP